MEQLWCLTTHTISWPCCCLSGRQARKFPSVWCLLGPLEGRGGTSVFVTHGIHVHPTDTEHKWPRGTDDEHGTSEAIVVQLPTNLSLSHKSHVHSLLLAIISKGLPKGTVNKTVRALQSLFFRAVHWVRCESAEEILRACLSLSPHSNEHLGANIKKKTSLEAMKNESQMKFLPLILPPCFANPLELLVIM